MNHDAIRQQSIDAGIPRETVWVRKGLLAFAPVNPPKRKPVVELDMSWQEWAACRDADTDWFFPEQGGTAWAKAKALCAVCPVKQACLNHANAVPEKAGIWGGLAPRERLAMRRRQRKERAA